MAVNNDSLPDNMLLHKAAAIEHCIDRLWEEYNKTQLLCHRLNQVIEFNYLKLEN